MEANIETQIAELMAWKERQEQAQADRLTEMRNAMVEIFVSRHATISEIQTVLEIVKQETVTAYIGDQKEKTRIATKEYPAKIKE